MKEIYQIQALTWRGGMAHQQDAMLIAPKVYQNRGLLVKLMKLGDFVWRWQMVYLAVLIQHGHHELCWSLRASCMTEVVRWIL